MQMGTWRGPGGGPTVVGGGSSGGTTQGVSILLSSHYISPRPGQTCRAGEGTVSLCQGIALRERKDEGPGGRARIQAESHVTAVQPKASVLTSLNLLACLAGSREVM